MKAETTQALESLGMDIPQTLARFVGNESMLLRFLDRLPNETMYAKMIEAMNAGDTQEAFHQAHTLKGVVGNLGLGTLFDAVGPMVETLRADDLSSAMAMLPEVDQAYQYAVTTIQTMPR